jgi:hypothetical protein
MKNEQANDQTTPSRRGFFMGAAAVGAATAAVTAMPGLPHQKTVAATA